MRKMFAMAMALTVLGIASPASAERLYLADKQSSGSTQIPEPSMLGLLGAALVGLGIARHKKRS